MEIHDLVRSSEPSQGVPPVSVGCNLWVPPSQLVNLLRDLVFQGVHNNTANRRKILET